MKTFYEMLEIMENDPMGMDQRPEKEEKELPQKPEEEGLGDKGPNLTNSSVKREDLKNYMFFSNLKIIKEKAEKLLSMDAKQIDSMLENGHDWARDHISTSRDDVEEVYNWIVGESESNQSDQIAGVGNQANQVDQNNQMQ